MICLPGWACAEEDGLRWNGFINVVGGMLKETPFTATDDGKGATGYRGYGDGVTFDRQTSAGLQATKPLDDTLSVTAQVYAEGRTENYAANLRWLYLTWEPTDRQRVRVGRIGEPIYYYSDFSQVGYAYDWISPPLDIYVYDPTLVGAAWQYQDVWRNWEWSTEVFGGTSDEYHAAIDAQTTTRNARGIVLSASTGGWLTLRALYLRQESSFVIDSLQPDPLIEGAFAAAVEQGQLTQAVADVVKPLATPVMTDYLSDVFALQTDAHYTQLAARADFGTWWTMAEWAELSTGEYLQNLQEAWYIAAGYRVGDLTLHLTYSEYRQPMSEEAQADASSAPASGSIPDQSLWLARVTAGTVASLYAGDWYTQIAGVSWYAGNNTAWKFEVTHFNNVPTLPTETEGTGSNILYNVGVSAAF